MPYENEQHRPVGNIAPLTTDIAGTVDNAVNAVRVDSLENLGADANANFRDLTAKVNAVLSALDTAGITI